MFWQFECIVLQLRTPSVTKLTNTHTHTHDNITHAMEKECFIYFVQFIILMPVFME